MDYDYIVIGGGAGGFSFIQTIKMFRPDSKILVIRKSEKQLIPCSIPYLIRTIPINRNIIPDRLYEDTNVEVWIDEAVKIDPNNKIIETKNGKRARYKKLVIATGAVPVKLRIPGIDLENVVLVWKEYNNIEKAVNILRKAHKVVIVGAGFVGLEFADELAGDKEVTIVEILDEALPLALDRELGRLVREELEKRGVRFLLNTTLEEIGGDKKVEWVSVGGKKLEADAVIISVGIAPNSEIAKSAGLELDPRGHIIVDSFMRTSNPDIYAVGDVAQKKYFFDGKPAKTYFSTLAVMEGRIAALHALGILSSRMNYGSLGAFLTKIGDLVVGAVGLTQKHASRLGIKTISVLMESVDRHPSSLPDTSKSTLKFVYGDDLRLLGFQGVGSELVGEILNFVTPLIQMGATAFDILQMQFATHPKTTPSPISHPVHFSALKAIYEAKK